MNCLLRIGALFGLAISGGAALWLCLMALKIQAGTAVFRGVAQKPGMEDTAIVFFAMAAIATLSAAICLTIINSE